MDDRLGVAGCRKRVAAPREIAPELAEVVDLAVEDHPNRAVFISYRLIAGLEVDDAQATHAETHPSGDVHAAGVGASMDHGVAHGLHTGGVDAGSRQARDSRNTAHDCRPLFSGSRST